MRLYAYVPFVPISGLWSAVLPAPSLGRKVLGSIKPVRADEGGWGSSNIANCQSEVINLKLTDAAGWRL